MNASDAQALLLTLQLAGATTLVLLLLGLPLSRRGLLSAVTLTFAHTLGEFGVVLMVGGNIPGQTRVLSIAIYDHAEALNYAAAHRLALLLLVASFVMLLGVYALNRRRALVRT